MSNGPLSPIDAQVAEIRAESEALFAGIGDGAIATDEFGHITRINPVALQILGLTAEEAQGQWFPKVVQILKPDGSPLPLIERPIVRMFLTGRAISEKALYITKQGRTVPVSITVSPIILDDRPVGAVQVFRDITIEDEIDRMKSEFISLASHQLRTPLSSVLTYAHMLDDGFAGQLANDQRRLLRTIITAGNTMNELIGMLLNIARIESGRISTTIKRVNLATLITEVVKQMHVVAANKSIVIRVVLPKSPVSIRSDYLILKEVLLNLLNNSLKYTPPYGKVTIRLRARTNDVVIDITDSGIGIPKAVQDKIFAKFFRAPNVVHQETTGTGLGLYVVQGLVAVLKGRVWFKSEENEGTTFYVMLPKNFPLDPTKRRQAL